MALRTASALVALTAIWVAISAGIAGAAGDKERGKAVFESQCAVCHETAPEFHKEGPSLAGVYGRRAGTAPFFAGYKGLRGADFVWDERTLDAWLADPRGLLGGKNTAMTLRLNDAGQRADVIAYLKTLR
jgi:cytochrome c